MIVSLSQPIAAYDYDLRIAGNKLLAHLRNTFGADKVDQAIGTYETTEDDSGKTIYIAIAEKVKLKNNVAKR